MDAGRREDGAGAKREDCRRGRGGEQGQPLTLFLGSRV